MPTGVYPHKQKPIKERFWSKVNIPDLFSCWEWTGTKCQNGYGIFVMNGKHIRAHRVSFLLSNGFIDDNLCVLHKCNNVKCVNPAHLYLGTPQDNTKDMINSNRQAKGKQIWTAKLNETQVKEILILCKANIHKTGIANQYSISSRQVYDICNRKRWKHVSE